MRINKVDVIWNYAATFLRIGSYALLLPFILRKMSAEMAGVWSVFMAITAFAALLDMGFSPSFVRNVTYIFSGVRNLKVNGFDVNEVSDQSVDYGLLKGMIVAMKWFYLRMAVILLFLLATLGTYYVFSLLKTYKADKTEVYISWVILCIISTYNIYTQYFDSLLQGRGMVRRSKQIIIIGQLVYLVVAAVLLIFNFGLLAIISAQALSVIIIRWLCYYTFFTPKIKDNLRVAVPRARKEVLNVVYPNAIKIGLNSIGAFVIQRSSIVIGSLNLPLESIASYGITLQFISIIYSFAPLYTATYTPKIVQLRVAQNTEAIKELYLRGQVILYLTYILGGACLLLFGNWGLAFIGSKVQLMPAMLVLLSIVISFLENNHGMAGAVLLTNNEVPFFKASLVAGAATVILLGVLFYVANMGLWAMVLAPGIAQLYNNWKWPHELFLQLKISKKDIKKMLTDFTKPLFA